MHAFIYINKKRDIMKKKSSSLCLGLMMAGILFVSSAGSYAMVHEKIEKEKSIETIEMENKDRNTQRPRAALTFDDGPGRYSEHLLDILKEKETPASFFLLGENLDGHEKEVMRMIDEGHLIGNHSYSHRELNRLSIEEIQEELERTNRKILDITGKEMTYMRPPFGAWEKSVEEQISMIPVMWNVDSLDWKLKNTPAIVKLVMEQVKDGDILLMHDGYQTSLEAAGLIIDGLKEKGYDLVTVDELINP